MKELNYKVAVAEIGHSPYYQAILQAVEKLAPLVPEFEHTGTSNIETIKYKLAQRGMHALIMRVLRGE